MRKFLGVMLSVVFVCGLAHAASTTATFGDRNSSGTYRMVADDGGTITLATDTVLTGGTINPTSSTIGTLVVTGTITDSAIYTKAATTYPQRLLTMGADGSIYGTRTVILDTGLYAQTTPASGTNYAKYLCIYLDGTIYPSTKACN